MGLEPTPSCEDRILSPARLPFRHFGKWDSFRMSRSMAYVNPSFVAWDHGSPDGLAAKHQHGHGHHNGGGG